VDRGAGVRRGDDLAFLMATGLRIGEACGLTWNAVDL
jgi:integrase